MLDNLEMFKYLKNTVNDSDASLNSYLLAEILVELRELNSNISNIKVNIINTESLAIDKKNQEVAIKNKKIQKEEVFIPDIDIKNSSGKLSVKKEVKKDNMNMNDILNELENNME
jgi:hypothetical protein